MYQGASQRSQFSQNSSTNYFSELLRLVIFPLNFQSRTLHVRQSLDRAFSITISVLECSLRLPCRVLQRFSKLSAKKAKQKTCSKKNKIPVSSHSPFSDHTEKKQPQSCILSKVVQLLQYIGLQNKSNALTRKHTNPYEHNTLPTSNYPKIGLM